MKPTKVKIADLDKFSRTVFGADCFLKYWPELLTTGVEVFRHTNGFYYIVKGGQPADGLHSFGASSCFFTRAEMKHLTPVE